MAAAKSQESHNVEFLDTTTGEVVARMDIEYKDDMEVALSPDEDQVAFLSNILVTICDIMHPEKCASFDFWPRKDVLFKKVAFQILQISNACIPSDILRFEPYQDVCNIIYFSMMVWGNEGSAIDLEERQKWSFKTAFKSATHFGDNARSCEFLSRA